MIQKEEVQCSFCKTIFSGINSFIFIDIITLPFDGDWNQNCYDLVWRQKDQFNCENPTFPPFLQETKHACEMREDIN